MEAPPIVQEQQLNVDQPGAMVLTLRQQLKSLQVWPEAGDTFLELLPLSRWHSPPLTKEDSQWLPQVVADALKGIDIGSRYPAFFQKLVTSKELCQAFLDELRRELRES